MDFLRAIPADINELAAAQVVVNSFFGGFLWHSMLSFISIFFSGCSSIN